MERYLLHHLLEDAARRYPGRDAVSFKGAALSYAELDLGSGRAAAALRGMGVVPGGRVGIFMNKSPEALAALYGILKAGAAYVPIDSLAPLDRIEYMVGNCGMRVAFASPDGAGKLAPLLEKPSCPLREVLVPGAWEGTPPAGAGDISDTGIAYILHTSGSTGMPKGVGLSHRNGLTFVETAAGYFRIETEDRLACHAPLQFDLTVFDIFTAAARGAAVVLVPETLSVFPMKLAQFIDEERITVWNSVASVLSLLAEHGKMERFRFDALRAVLFSGDVLPVKYLRKLKGILPRARFYNVYGQTEANSSTCYPVDRIPEGENWRIPIGKPFPNFEVFALTDGGEIAREPGQVGELHVRSSSVAAGYWRDEARTAEAFVTDPGSALANRKVYRTGDLATLDENGDYLFLGRKDHQVKSRGYRIQLNEIEAVLNNHPAVKEAVVVAVPDEMLGNRIVSHVARIEGAGATEPELFEYCARTLPPYMLPEKVVFHDAMPRTPTGKTDRNALRERSREAL